MFLFLNTVYNFSYGFYMHILAAFVITVCLFAGFHPIKENPIGEINLDVGVNTPVEIDLNIRPLAEIQNRNIVHQGHDYSCGSAALATLLNFYLGESFTETQVIQGLMQYGNAQKIAQRRAFSLLDMKQFVNRLGYKGAGYKADIQDLIELEMPCIVPIEFLGYRHFTVFRGIHGNHVFLSDPFRGNTSYTIQTFEDMWYGNIAFIVYPEGGRELTALELKNEDLLYIHEDTIDDLLQIHEPYLAPPTRHEKEFFYTLPDGFRKYRSR